MKDLLGTLVKAVVLLVGAALALYGAYCLYKKFIAKPEQKEFADTLDYDADFGYEDNGYEEDKIAQTIKAAKNKIETALNV